VWHTFLVASFVVIVGVGALSWVVGRFHSTAATAMSLFAGLVGRIAVVAVMAYSTVKASGHGGWFIALAAVFVVIGVGAIVTSVITAGALWLLISGRTADRPVKRSR
jgi:hypothetical protein